MARGKQKHGIATVQRTGPLGSASAGLVVLLAILMLNISVEAQDLSAVAPAASVISASAVAGPPTQAEAVSAPPVLSPGEKSRLESLQASLPLPGPAIPQVGVPQPPPPGSQTNIGPAPSVPGTFTFFSNSTPNPVIPLGSKSTIDEPSTGMSGRVRFMTGNWYAAFSNNAGTTWTHLSPFTTFASADGGFCCDQVAMYEPSRDMMFWLLQYIKSGTTTASRGRLRLAVFRNTNNNIGAAGWIFYDFLPSQVGGPATGEWFDYPHMALSNDFVYIAVNVFRTTDNVWTRTVIMRLPLDPIRAGAGFGFSFLSWTANFTFTPIQGAKDVMYWASHNSTSQMRVFRWPEDSGSISTFNLAVTPWTSTPRGSSSCPTGDGQNWCLRTDQRILTGARSWNHLTRQSELWFLWNVRQGGNFPRPYIDAVRFRESDLANVGRPLIWSTSTPWHYVAAAPNARGDIGLSLFLGAGTAPTGGPGFFPSHAVCIDDDFNGVPPGWECTFTRIGTNGPSNNGWGDYVAVRPNHPSGLGWQATGYTLQGGKAGSNVEPRNVVFGRERDLNADIRWRLK